MRTSKLVLAFLVSLHFFPLLSKELGKELDKSSSGKASPPKVAAVKPPVQDVSANPLTANKGQVKCGQTLYLLGAQQPPSDVDVNAKTSSTGTSFYPVTIPACDGSGDFVLQVKNGTVALASVEKPSLELLPLLTSGKSILVLVVFLCVSLALVYVGYDRILLPNVRKTVRSQMLQGQVYSEPFDAAAKATPAPSKRQTNNPAAVTDVARQITDFRTGEFRRLSERVERLESEQLTQSSRSAPPPQLVKHEAVKHEIAEFTPPIVTTLERSPYEQFIDAVNKARIDLGAREQFMKRYKPKALEVANSVEVTRSKERPVFAPRDGGNLLALPTSNVDGEVWPEGHFYLVPSVQLRWTNERIKGGSWDYFFDVKSVNGDSALIEAAVVKQAAGSWEVADERRGEMTWDPNVAAS